MEASLQRGRILMQQGRHALAEEEFRKFASALPDDGSARALLALSLLAQEKWDDALLEAQAAIARQPDWGFAHYVHANVLVGRNRYAEARRAIDEAISLDPTDPDFHALLAGIHHDESRFADALRAAEAALEQEPEHVAANNVRAIALRKLGRRREAGATIDAALARDPENSATHANQGWTLLESGRRAEAMEHFREALRLDPNNEWAREGILEALKAGNPIYAGILAYFFWMQRFDQRKQFMILFAGVVGYQFLNGLRRSSPDFAPFIVPLQVAYLLFVLMSWTAIPLGNLVLRLNRFGRLALTEEEVSASNWVGGTLAGALALVAAWGVTGMEGLGLAAMGVAFMLIPIASVFRCAEGWPRRAMVVYTVVLASTGALGLVAPGALAMFVLLLIGSSWVANYLVTRRPQR